MGELLATCSSRELAEWRGLYTLEHEEHLQAEAASRAEAKLDKRKRRR